MSRECNNGFEEWGGYMDAKITKLEEQFSAASDPFRKTNLFDGISIFVNGHTNPSADELKRIMMVHGGTYHHYERSYTTYIIASNLPDVKVRNMNTSKIISAQWVVDCLQEQRLLDYTKYLLYTNQRTTQPSLEFMLKKKKNEDTQKPFADVPRVQEQQLLNGRQNLISPKDPRLKRSLDVKNEKIEDNSDTLRANNTNNSSNTLTSSAALTAVDPKFLSEFYNNSRLHHIATLGAEFKQYINELRLKHNNAGFPCRAELKQILQDSGLTESSFKSSDWVMHIDMDCFFVSVGLRKYPHLHGLPIAVTHSKGGSKASEVSVHPDADRQKEMELFSTRFEQHLNNNILSDKVRHGFEGKMSLAEISSCSYEARAKGIKNGMFVGQALKLCPELKTIPYDFEGYREVAFTLYNTMAQYTLNIEAVSCDEMYVDLSDLLKDMQISPMVFVKAVRNEVRQKTGCPCSAGVGRNKLQARMATKRAKPDGQYQLMEGDVDAYMAEIPISDLPGVGTCTMYSLDEAGYSTCGDLQMVSLAKLQTLVGKKLGETLHKFCRGDDNRPLVYGQVRKSVSAEVNYGIRFSEYSELETFLRQLCNEVHTRLKDIQRKTKCITLKVMVRAKDAPLESSKFMGHGLCDNVTKSVSLSRFTDDLQLIKQTVLATMKSMALPPNELRGIGIQLTKLDEPNEPKEKKENVIKNMFTKIAEKKTQKENLSESEVTQGVASMPQLPKLTLLDENMNTDGNILKSVDDNNKLTLLNETTTTALPTMKRPRSRFAPETNEPKKLFKDIRTMLKEVPVEESTEVINKPTARPQIPPDVDPDVFAVLPYEIREEILREYAENIEINASPKKIQNFHPILCEAELNDTDLGPSTSKAAKERLERRNNQAKDLSQEKFKGVDEEFLRALPPDIRAEIEMELEAEKGNRNAPEIMMRDLHEVGDKPPEVLFAECEKTAFENISDTNIFAQAKCKDLLLKWVQSCEVPHQYDIYVMCTHARQYVHNKLLDQLYEPLMYLCRIINEQKSDAVDCSWHVAYTEIIAAVQLEMSAIYEGRKLFLGVKLNCDKCC